MNGNTEALLEASREVCWSKYREN